MRNATPPFVSCTEELIILVNLTTNGSGSTSLMLDGGVYGARLSNLNSNEERPAR